MENTQKINDILLDKIPISISLSTPTPTPNSEMNSELEKKGQGCLQNLWKINFLALKINLLELTMAILRKQNKSSFDNFDNGFSFVILKIISQ